MSIVRSNVWSKRGLVFGMEEEEIEKRMRRIERTIINIGVCLEEMNYLMAKTHLVVLDDEDPDNN